jgi:CheY-like chemotaxis protein
MVERMRVLVVEDDRDLSYLYRSFLEEEGYEVMVANDGRRTLQLLRRHPDLVLLDLRLPDVDGQTLLRHMHADRAAREIPVVVVSATVPDDRSLPGAAAVVRKPFAFAELSRAIATASHGVHTTH